MTALGLNTIGNVCEVALLSAAGELSVRRTEMTAGHDAHLAPMTRDLLSAAGIAPDRVRVIAVITGPGSFTGARVGVAFARGLALGLGARAVGVSAFEAMEGAPSGRCMGVLPARRRPPDRSWWIQPLFSGAGAGPVEEVDIQALMALAAGDCPWIGEGFPDEEAGVVCLPSLPSARRAIDLALASGQGDGVPVRPLYVRAPDAVPSRNVS